MTTLCLIHWIVFAQAQAPASQPSKEELEKEFAKTLAEDKAGATASQPAVQQSAAAGAPTSTSTPTSSAALSNPEIAVIGTFSGTARRNGDVSPAFIAGDDPPPQGAAVQELELSFAADVDPYFKMRAFLTIPASGELEIEEAFLLTTSLPRGFQFKGGAFRSSFGRNNQQHLHVQDFARRPKMTQLLGEDGLRAPGGQLSWLSPLPWYASFFVEYLGVSEDVSITAGLEQFFDLSEAWSLYVGSAFATLQEPADDAGVLPPREYLFDGWVYLKWKPPNVVSTYWWVAFTAEYAASRNADQGWDGAGYGQIVAQIARRWRAGVRVDLVGYPQVADEPVGNPQQLLQRDVSLTASLAFLPSEFSRVRLTFAHDQVVDDTSQNNDYWILQFEAAIGAHGAHPF